MSRPGELVHLDIKKLGRIPRGGGWRAHGRGNANDHKVTKIGYAFVHTAIDGYSRLAYSEVLDNEQGPTAADFWIRASAFFTDHGITVERVLTDNGACYRSQCLRHGARAGPAQLHEALSTADQRQSRALQSHAPGRVGLCPNLDVRGTTDPPACPLASHLQPSSAPHRRRRASHQPCRQRRGALQLGIEKGKPFDPDDRMRDILTRASQLGNAQLRVQSFADRRPDREVWPGTTWEWAVLRPENGTFDAETYTDNYARQKWFYQAQIESPAMFKRSAGAGSLYWLNTRDSTGAFLDGSNRYSLNVPQPVPDKLFWSITVYDAETRSEILTDQNKAALRSMLELADAPTDGPVELHFGPTPPPEGEDRWIKTIHGKGWFVYFRIYGPDRPAFDGSWQLPDFARL